MNKIDYSKKEKELFAALKDIAAGMPPGEAAIKHRVNRVSIWKQQKLLEKFKAIDPIIFDKYATTDTKELADGLGITSPQLRKRAGELGRCKCKIFMKQQQSEIQKKAKYGFKAGNEPQTKNNLKHKRQRSPVAVFQENAQSLRYFGFDALSKLSEGVIKKVYANRTKGIPDERLDFLKVHSG